MWNEPPKISTDPLWEVVLEVIKNEMYCYKGQELHEMVQAPDKDSAVEQVCKSNDISIENIVEKGVRLWKEE